MDRSLAVAGAVALAALGFGLAAWPATPQPPPTALVSDVTRRTVTVHVSGAVSHPGLVTLDADGRVADAIVAAGGATPDGDPGALNLAASVGDGGRIVVPYSGQAVGDAADGLIRINVASASDLEGLPGVGPVLAERIVAVRDDHGPFEAAEDLLSVPGIGEAKLASIRDLVMVP